MPDNLSNLSYAEMVKRQTEEDVRRWSAAGEKPLWIVTIASDITANGMPFWELVGIFDDRQKAQEAFSSPANCIVPTKLNQPMSQLFFGVRECPAPEEWLPNNG